MSTLKITLSRSCNHMMVTVGPCELLLQVSKAISNANTQIEMTDPVIFRDAAFPDGDWRVARLFEEGNRRRVASETGVEYLILISDEQSLKLLQERAAQGEPEPNERSTNQ